MAGKRRGDAAAFTVRRADATVPITVLLRRVVPEKAAAEKKP
jgi:hypothetical protein